MSTFRGTSQSERAPFLEVEALSPWESSHQMYLDAPSQGECAYLVDSNCRPVVRKWATVWPSDGQPQHICTEVCCKVFSSSYNLL